MDKVLVDRGLLAECVSVCIRAFGVGDPIEAKLRAILAQPAEAEGVVPVVGYLVDVPDEPDLGHWYEEEAEEEGEDLGPPLTRCQPLVRQSDHLAALSAVTAERDRLRDMINSANGFQDVLERERDQLRAEVEALRKAFNECIQSLHDEMLASYGGQKPQDMHPVTRRNYDRDMAEIAEYRAAMDAKEA